MLAFVTDEKVKRTLRIFLSNTCANQPFQLAEKEQSHRAAEQADNADGDDDGDGDTEGVTAPKLENTGMNNADDVPSWTLRIEGRLLDPSFRSRAGAARASRRAGARRRGRRCAAPPRGR